MKKFIFLSSIAALSLASCKKEFLNTSPSSGTITDVQIQELGASNPSALVKLTDPTIKGIYAFMRTYNTWGTGAHDDFGQKAVDLGLDLMTEDMVAAAHSHFGFDYLVDNREATYRRPGMVWNFYYKIIYNSNLLLDQIDPATTDAQLKSIRGQALSLRAHAYHYLVQLFAKTYKGNEGGAGVPIYTSAKTLEGAPRSKVSEVYALILSDLNTAVTLLQPRTTSKEDIDQNVAYGMLARVHVTMENWAEAESAANKAKQGITLMSATGYKDGFSDVNNVEWMWGQIITKETSSIYASFFSQIDNTSGGYAGLAFSPKLISKKLYDQIPATDVRKQVYKSTAASATGTFEQKAQMYAQLKFRDPAGDFTGDYIFMRAAEMYLIEAEAQARQGKTAAAQQTLYDLISKRDASYTMSTKTGASLIEEILLQRRIELWGEGLAMLDLKRLNRGIDRTGSNHRTDATLVIPGGDPRWTYKIPVREFESNPKITLAEQNP